MAIGRVAVHTSKRHPAAYAAGHPGAGPPSPRLRSSPPCLSAVPGHSPAGDVKRGQVHILRTLGDSFRCLGLVRRGGGRQLHAHGAARRRPPYEVRSTYRSKRNCWPVGPTNDVVRGTIPGPLGRAGGTAGPLGRGRERIGHATVGTTKTTTVGRSPRAGRTPQPCPSNSETAPAVVSVHRRGSVDNSCRVESWVGDGDLG
jgi:hypothetical protein